MKCKNCSVELLDNISFCPYCGTKCDEQKIEVIDSFKIDSEDPILNQDAETSAWSKFANLSNIFGIITLCVSWIPLVGLIVSELGIVGIVFGALGKRSKKEAVKEQASSGFIKSLIGTILSIVLSVVWYVLFILGFFWIIFQGY